MSATPLTLQTDEPPPQNASRDLTPVLIATGALALVLAAVACVLIWKRTLAANPGAHAMRTLARSLKLSTSDKRTVRAIAEHINVQPECLLVTPGGFSQAAARYIAQSPAPDDAETARALIERIGDPEQAAA